MQISPALKYSTETRKLGFLIWFSENKILFYILKICCKNKKLKLKISLYKNYDLIKFLMFQNNIFMWST